MCCIAFLIVSLLTTKICSQGVTQFNCDGYNDTFFEIESGFRIPNGDFYFFTADGFLSKVRSFDSGKWFQVYENYPKNWSQWIKDDFIAEYRLHYYSSFDNFLYLDGHSEFNQNRHEYKWNSMNKKFEFQRIFIVNKDITQKYQSLLRIKDTVSKVGNLKRERLHYTKKSGVYCIESIEETEISKNNASQEKIYHMKSDICVIRSLGAMINFDVSKGSIGYSFQAAWSIPFYIEPRKPKVASTAFTILQTSVSSSIDVNKGNSEFPSTESVFRLVVPNKIWFGCPRLDCIRLFVDAATKVEKNWLFVFSGRHFYRSNSIYSKPELTFTIKETFRANVPDFIDAAFTDRITKGVYLVKENHFWIYRLDRNALDDNKGKKLDVLFNGVSSGGNEVENIVVDEKSNASYVFFSAPFAGSVWRYQFISNTSSAKPIDSKWVSHININLPQRIDAVFTDPDSDDKVLVKHNFAVTIERNKFYVTQSTKPLEFNILFGCKNYELNPFFKEELSKYGDISKPNKFVPTGTPPPIFTNRTKVPSDVTKMTDNFSTNQSVASSLRGSDVVIIVVIGALIIFVSVIFLFLCVSKNRSGGSIKTINSQETTNTLNTGESSKRNKAKQKDKKSKKRNKRKLRPKKRNKKR
ncbi:hypothetical protein B4U80_12835 [Leptotrombidium deliense]|uniref:Uncharacterized protein n=1 Tax=Leptotrombidium deliense TaxID=299467 RepID=A0A443SJX4_9ACAR|nr:hypothetical protein B4U80_12835 [Leptotrombidium deliense]